MPVTSLEPIDTRRLFRPVSSALVTLLRDLPLQSWNLPTVAGQWVARDVVAHLVDLTSRRLSFDRDRMPPPPPAQPITSEQDFVRFINSINAEWVNVARRFSPRVLTDMFEQASAALADWFESLPEDAPALFGVSWAGEQTSAGWFDIGREFTELWHHQEQIRMAVGAESLEDPRYLQAVIGLAVRALPHAYRETHAEVGTRIVLDVTGPAGGKWTVSRTDVGWTLDAGEAPAPAALVRIPDSRAWQLFFNALPQRSLAQAVQVEGRTDLARPLLAARSIVI